MVEREEAEADDPWREHRLPPSILAHTIRYS
jgi:hypothetical protein